jgi:hypothetical protein
LIDAKGLEYVSPEYDRNASEPAEVQRLVTDLWELKNELGQAGMNADRLRERLAE